MSVSPHCVSKPVVPPPATVTCMYTVADRGGGAPPVQFHFIIGSHTHHMLDHMLDLDQCRINLVAKVAYVLPMP